MLTTLLGIITLVKRVQLSNASPPIFVILSGIVILVKFSQNQNALRPMLVTPFFITIDLIFLQLGSQLSRLGYQLSTLWLKSYISPFPLIVKVPLLSSFQVTFFPHFPDVAAMVLGETSSTGSSSGSPISVACGSSTSAASLVSSGAATSAVSASLPSSVANTLAGRTLRHMASASMRAIHRFPCFMYSSYSLFCGLHLLPKLYHNCMTHSTFFRPFSPNHLLLAPI